MAVSYLEFVRFPRLAQEWQYSTIFFISFISLSSLKLPGYSLETLAGSQASVGR